MKWIALALAGALIPCAALAQPPADPYAPGQWALYRQKRDRALSDLTTLAVTLGNAVHCRVINDSSASGILAFYSNQDTARGIIFTPDQAWSVTDAYRNSYSKGGGCSDWENDPHRVHLVRQLADFAAASNATGIGMP